MDPHGKDQFLAKLVEVANRMGMSFGITLTAGGLTISGRLISAKDWFDEQASKIKAATGAEDIHLHSVFEMERDLIAKHEGEMTALQDAIGEAELATRYYQAVGEVDPISYIHLAEASVHYPSDSFPAGNSGLWRGRLEEVTGWGMGQLRHGDA